MCSRAPTAELELDDPIPDEAFEAAMSSALRVHGSRSALIDAAYHTRIERDGLRVSLARAKRPLGLWALGWFGFACGEIALVDFIAQGHTIAAAVCALLACVFAATVFVVFWRRA